MKRFNLKITFSITEKTPDGKEKDFANFVHLYSDVPQDGLIGVEQILMKGLKEMNEMSKANK